MPVSAVSIASGTYTAIGNNASGTQPTSGTGGNTSLSGPWRIETQELTIEYVRVPRLTTGSRTGYSLSGDLTTTKSVASTYVQARVTARVKVSKSYELFSTSGYYQSQRFVIAADPQDAYGNTYGDLSAGGTLTMGPGGTVLTNTPGYSRRYWDDSIDVEFDQVGQGYTHAFKKGHLQSNITPTVTPCSEKFGDFEVVNNPLGANSLQANADETVFQVLNTNPYLILGKYETNNESDVLVRTFVDSIGARCANGSFYPEEPELHPTIQMPQAITNICPAYQVWRHDWS